MKTLILTQDMRVSKHRLLCEERAALQARYAPLRAQRREREAAGVLGELRSVTNKLMKMGNVNSRGVPV